RLALEVDHHPVLTRPQRLPEVEIPVLADLLPGRGDRGERLRALGERVLAVGQLGEARGRERERDAQLSDDGAAPALETLLVNGLRSEGRVRLVRGEDPVQLADPLPQALQSGQRRGRWLG